MFGTNTTNLFLLFIERNKSVGNIKQKTLLICNLNLHVGPSPLFMRNFRSVKENIFISCGTMGVRLVCLIGPKEL